MTALKTRDALLSKLKQAADRKLSAEEIYKQRVSFIMGSLSSTSNVTRAQVKEVLEDFEGRKRA